MKDSLLEPGLAAGMDIHAVLGLQLFAAPRLAAQILLGRATSDRVMSGSGWYNLFQELRVFLKVS